MNITKSGEVRVYVRTNKTARSGEVH